MPQRTKLPPHLFRLKAVTRLLFLETSAWKSGSLRSCFSRAERDRILPYPPIVNDWKSVIDLGTARGFEWNRR